MTDIIEITVEPMPDGSFCIAVYVGGEVWNRLEGFETLEQAEDFKKAWLTRGDSVLQ